jgi:ubiquinone/menaquinone biosynthesis C-methylase UbiE
VTHVPDHDLDPRVEQRYHEEADLYESAVEPIFQPTLEALLDRASLQPGERVLDVGTGPGLLALLAAERVGPEGSVLGVDVAEGMVRVARERAATLSQITFERRNANALNLPDDSFDAVLSSFALHFTDPNRSLRELYRVLRPNGGRLAFTSPGLNWGPSGEVQTAINTARERYLSPEALEWASEIDHSNKRTIARWALLAPDVFEARLRQLGFGQVLYEKATQPFIFSGPRAVWDWTYAATGLRRFLADWPGERQAAFHDSMTAAVASVLGEGELALQWEVIRLLAVK